MNGMQAGPGEGSQMGKALLVAGTLSTDRAEELGRRAEFDRNYQDRVAGFQVGLGAMQLPTTFDFSTATEIQDLFTQLNAMPEGQRALMHPLYERLNVLIAEGIKTALAPVMEEGTVVEVEGDQSKLTVNFEYPNTDPSLIAIQSRRYTLFDVVKTSSLASGGIELKSHGIAPQSLVDQQVTTGSNRIAAMSFDLDLAQLAGLAAFLESLDLNSMTDALQSKINTMTAETRGHLVAVQRLVEAQAK